jgi:hypothetical protein
MTWKTLIIVTAFALLAGCGGSGESESASTTGDATGTDEPVEAAAEFAVGDAVDLEECFSATIIGAKTQPTAGAIIADTELYLTRASEGMTFVAVDYTITNNGEIEEYFLFSPQLVDASGMEIECNLDATTNYSVHELVRTEPEEENPNYNSASTYSPGEYKTKAVVFEVDPAAWEAGGWSLIMEDAGIVVLN